MVVPKRLPPWGALVVMNLGFAAGFMVLLTNSLAPEYSATGTRSAISPNKAPTTSDCTVTDEEPCTDVHGYQAIRNLHAQLDDDQDGHVDVSESDEFLREELEYENGHQERQKAFHLNKKSITVQELWESWRRSEVHNWTVQHVVEWLEQFIELPQYAQVFLDKNVDGSVLPRLASSTQYLSGVLGIKDPIHKQKISLKAMDVVLFGVPKQRNTLKDTLLVTSLAIAFGGCFFAYMQRRSSQKHLKRIVQDMESLQKAEEQLMELQRELDSARKMQESAVLEKEDLERRLQDGLTGKSIGSDSDRDSGGSGDEGGPSAAAVSAQRRCRLLEEELRTVREELRRTERVMEENRSWHPPPALQQWLQLTHELELRNYNAKKLAAEAQLQAAKEGCEKLRKKRSSMLGTLRLTHGSSIDDVDSRILQARAALTELTQVLQERVHRWRQVELLCGFSIVNNPGLPHLQTLLRGGSAVNGGLHLGPLSHSQASFMHGSQDEEEMDGMSTIGSISAVPPSYSTIQAVPAGTSAGGPPLPAAWHPTSANPPSAAAAVSATAVPSQGTGSSAVITPPPLTTASPGLVISPNLSLLARHALPNHSMGGITLNGSQHRPPLMHRHSGNSLLEGRMASIQPCSPSLTHAHSTTGVLNGTTTATFAGASLHVNAGFATGSKRLRSTAPGAVTEGAAELSTFQTNPQAPQHLVVASTGTRGTNSTQGIRASYSDNTLSTANPAENGNVVLSSGGAQSHGKPRFIVGESSLFDHNPELLDSGIFPVDNVAKISAGKGLAGLTNISSPSSAQIHTQQGSALWKKSVGSQDPAAVIATVKPVPQEKPTVVRNDSSTSLNKNNINLAPSRQPAIQKQLSFDEERNSSGDSESIASSAYTVTSTADDNVSITGSTGNGTKTKKKRAFLPSLKQRLKIKTN